jgi:hypothetical protein
MKKFAIILGGLVIVLAVVIYLVIANIGSIIVAIVEEVGSDVTKVKVELNSADVDFGSGKGNLSGLTVGNPAGFKTDQALELEKISVWVDTKTIDKDVIVIKEVVIDRPEVTYELGSNGSNIDTIQKNVQQASASSQTAKQDAPSQKKVIIEKLLIRNGKIDVSGGPLAGRRLGTALPNIQLNNIGKEGGQAKGATPAEVAQKVIGAISRQAQSAVANFGALQDVLNKNLGGAAGSVKEKAGGLLDKGKSLFGK